MITAIGGDHYGQEILEVYRKEGVGTEYVRVNKNKPTNYHFVLTYKAERTILIKHQEYEYVDPKVLEKKPTGFISLRSRSTHCRSIKKLGTYLKGHPDVRMGFNPGTFQLRFGAEKLREIYKHTYVVFVNREEAELVLRKEGRTSTNFSKGCISLARRSS